MPLPPGQHAIEGFPRFGTHGGAPPPEVPVDPVIDVAGTTVRIADLADHPDRVEVDADVHCVAGWSATGLRWEGVPVRALVRPAAGVTHLRFVGLDGHASVADLEDLEGALIADRLDGEPLTGAHGAPARLVSPGQYGFVSTKHLCRIECLTSAPRFSTGAASTRAAVALGALGFTVFTRARVDREERHAFLPAVAIRRVVAPIVTRLR